MALIALARGYYDRQDNVPTPLVNMYYEADPTNLKDGTSLISRPGQAAFLDTEQDFIAGLIRREDANQTALAVAGTNAYIVEDSGLTSAGTGIAGTSHVRMATDGANIMIAREGILYLQSDTTATAVEMPDDVPVIDVVYLAGRFWIGTTDDGKVYFTVPGETTVDPLNYFSAENSPDPLVGLAVDGDVLMLLGRSSIEYWNPNADPDLPATRQEGRKSLVGCASVHSIASTDVGVAWVGDDGIVYRSSDLPSPISDASFAEMIRQARGELDDTDITKTLLGWTYTLEQHVFYVLNIPTKGTFAFDFSTNQWSRFETIGQDVFGVTGAIKYKDGEWICGGLYDGKIRYLTPDAETDDGTPMVRQFPALVPVNSPTRCDTLALECTVGAAALTYPDDNPKIAMRWSDDRGNTWSQWRYTNLGQQGRYTTTPYWTRMGSMRNPGRLFEFRTSANRTFTVRSGRYNEPIYR